ncbi:Jouberin [Rhizophlyctis rosea]|nr:Jouberin [Rhizophlyctis rosea]
MKAKRKKDKSKKKERDKEEEMLPPSIFDHVRKRPEDFVNCITCVTVHGTDELMPDMKIVRPVVKVSFVDIRTGAYILKKHPKRPATTFHEPEYMDWILPVMTTRCAPKSLTTSSPAPQWEEELLVNEDYLYFVDNPNVMALFEVLDMGRDGGYVTMSGRPAPPQRQVTYRPRSAMEIEKGKLTLDQLLNLYEARKRGAEHDLLLKSLMDLNPDLPEWSRKPGQRCKLPNKIMYRIDPGGMGASSASFSPTGTYLAIACLPHSTSSGGAAGSLLQTSSAASLGACAIKIYRVLDGTRVGVCLGHSGMVYSVAWGGDGTVFSASADGSVCAWIFDPESANTAAGRTRLDAVMQHPGYVYSLAVYTESDEVHTLATGCYDTLIRLYIYSSSSYMRPAPSKRIRQPYQTLRGHDAPVNAVAFGKAGVRLYSADAGGVIKVWNLEDGRGGSDELGRRYVLLQGVLIFQGTAITSLTLHPSTRKLLVRTAHPTNSFGTSNISSTLHILDTRIHRILTSYIPPSSTSSPQPQSDHSDNSKSPKTLLHRSTVTPCGTYVFETTPSSQTRCYRSEGEKVTAIYQCGSTGKENNVPTPIVDVSFHPWEHLCCFVGFGQGGKVEVWRWKEGYGRVGGGEEEEVVYDSITSMNTLASTKPRTSTLSKHRPPSSVDSSNTSLERKLKARKKEYASFADIVRKSVMALDQDIDDVKPVRRGTGSGVRGEEVGLGEVPRRKGKLGSFSGKGMVGKVVGIE